MNQTLRLLDSYARVRLFVIIATLGLLGLLGCSAIRDTLLSSRFCVELGGGPSAIQIGIVPTSTVATATVTR